MVLTESHCYLTHCVDPPVIVSLKMTPHLKQVVTHEPMMISVCKSACSDVTGVSVSLVMYPCLVLANVYTESPLSPASRGCSLSQDPVTMATSTAPAHRHISGQTNQHFILITFIHNPL